ncbi:MAG: Xaa-Pro peptidase family protein, partial [Pseudomonadota bacterium]
MITKRDLLKTAAASTAMLGVGHAAMARDDETSQMALPAPISNEERRGRIERAQALMQQQGMAALVLEAGTSMLYFSGLPWRQSSRLTAVVIPAEGAPVIITPAFEERKLRELMVMEMEVRTWQEHESPYRLIGGVIRESGLEGNIGLEGTVRFFVADGLKQDVQGHDLVAAASVVSALRQIKSPREIELMQAANNITYAAYREVFAQIDEGMTGPDISAIMNEATRRRGARPVFSLALIGEASSYPHGSKKVHTVKEGEIILMDCGCDVHGYKSDISRTWVHGEAN